MEQLRLITKLLHLYVADISWYLSIPHRNVTSHHIVQKIQKKGVPTDTCATSQDDSSGTTYILTVHQTLYIGDHGIDHSILNPNQLRAHGTEVQYNPCASTQCHIDTCFENIIVPLFTQVTVIFVNTRLSAEVELSSYVHITLKFSKILNHHEIRFNQFTNVIENGQFVMKACEPSRRIYSTHTVKPRMVSAPNSI